ncbi:hypothetical protein [Agrococcus versicolor]|uniref:hypothetical protein n=1 Tax=Agrococcus versicolor TaxID=501482 RepID=UPI0031DB172E
MWIELVVAVVGGGVLGGLLIAGRSVAPGATWVVGWVALAGLGVASAVVVAIEPWITVSVGLAVAVAVVAVGAPWAAGRADPNLRALPYWTRLRADARLRADTVRRDARDAQDVAPQRDLSTPDAGRQAEGVRRDDRGPEDAAPQRDASTPDAGP